MILIAKTISFVNPAIGATRNLKPKYYMCSMKRKCAKIVPDSIDDENFNSLDAMRRATMVGFIQ